MSPIRQLSRQFFRGLRNLFRPERANSDARDEVDSFLAEAKADFEARGLSSDEANRQARIRFGSTTAARENIRSDGWERIVSETVSELRYALRRLRSAPAFTLVSIATLALGLGATSAIFTIINGVLLKPLPYSHSEQLVALWLTAPRINIKDLNMAPSEYYTMVDENRAFQGVCAWTDDRMAVTGFGKPETIHAVFATHELLPILDINPQLGRFFTAADDEKKGERTVMLSDGYWRSHFGAERSVIGRRLILDGDPHTIIGVLPSSFQFLNEDVDLLMPLQFDRAKVFLGNFSYKGVGRLKAGVSLEKADADVARMLPLMIRRFPSPPGYTSKMFEGIGVAPNLRPLKNDVVGDIGSTLWILMGTVGLVLLIACANVANLLLVRADARQHELAIRAALGAGWARIARELLFESLILAAAAGITGLIIASAALKFLASSDLVHLPRAHNIVIDPWVVLFTFSVAVATSVLFGLIPVFRYAKPRVATALRSGGRSMSQSRERHRMRGLLVVVQVALALVLLVSSGLMLRTFRALRQVEPGFTHPETIQTASVGIPHEQAKETERVIPVEHAMLDNISALGGVTSVSMTTAVPMSGGESNDPVYTEDRKYREGQVAPLRRFQWIAPGYFATMGQRFIAGRDLTWSELHNAAPVAILSENTARDLWHSPQEALGKRIRTRAGDSWYEVIGVVANSHTDGVDKPASAFVYWPLLQKGFEGEGLMAQRNVSFVIRTSRTGSLAFLDELRQAIWKVAPDLPLSGVNTLETYYNRSLARTSFTLILLVIAGGMALLLGVIGIYGVIAYSVAQRTREIGIRLALGAPLGNVTNLFLREGLVLSAIGAVCGIAAAFLLTRLMKSLLFSVSPADPFTYIAMSAVLIASAALASFIPARRTSRVNPVEALRAE